MTNEELLWPKRAGSEGRQHLLRRLPRGRRRRIVRVAAQLGFHRSRLDVESPPCCALWIASQRSFPVRGWSSVLLDGADVYGPGVDPVSVRKTIGMVFQRPNPFPAMSIRDNVVAGLKLQGVRNRALLDETAERSLKGANLWNEVRTASISRVGFVRWSAAEAVHCPCYRGAARCPADG